MQHGNGPYGWTGPVLLQVLRTKPVCDAGTPEPGCLSDTLYVAPLAVWPSMLIITLQSGLVPRPWPFIVACDIVPATSMQSTCTAAGRLLTDFAPAHTTATGVLPSSVRSAEMSMLTSPPLRHTHKP